MDLLWLVDRIGENWTLALGGALIGMLFGAAAQKSRFCLRAATVEFARGRIGEKTALWLVVFTAAIAGTALLRVNGLADTSEARQIASPQSLSGAAIGGLMFGAGMVLARGCASRLLVLAATGNLRALLSGLVFAVVAQASLYGILSPLREAIAAGFVTPAGGNDILQIAGVGAHAAAALAVAAVLAALGFALFRRLGAVVMGGAFLTGLAVPAAWWFTSAMSEVAFEPVQMNSITFTGPSASFLMLFLNGTGEGIDFSSGLVPGVFLGSFLAAFMTRELQLQGFEGGASMRRYLTGAALMGFGGMLAGGCAVGAGVTGASVFALTAWVTLFAMWLSAGVTDWLVDRPALSRPSPSPAAL